MRAKVSGTNTERGEQMSKRVSVSDIKACMSNNGKPTSHDEAKAYANLMRTLLKVGLSESQATAIMQLTYVAKRGYSFDIDSHAWRVKYATMRKNAEENPLCKDAAELQGPNELAAWMTPNVHNAIPE